MDSSEPNVRISHIMQRIKTLFLAVSLSLLAIGCVSPSGPRIHVASATKADLVAAKDADTVWYEFKPGDEVPFQFLFIGVAVAGNEPIVLHAKEHFWLVMSENQPMRISYDGRTVAQQQTELVVAIVPDENDKAKVMWLNYVGKGSAQEELSKFSSDAAEPAAQ